ncbi:MAG: glycosyltransferase family 4 protein [Candidatus Hodarchaeota archaeon]
MGTKKNRIFFITNSREYGGSEEYLFMLAKGLDKDLFEISLICHDFPGLEDFTKRIEAEGVRVFKIPNADSFVRKISGKLRLLKDADIVHFNLPNPRYCAFEILLAFFARTRVRIATIHLPIILKSKYLLKTKFTTAYLRLVLLTLTRIITVSEASKELLCKRYLIERDKIEAILNGIFLEPFTNLRVNQTKKRQELDLKEGDTLIGTVARLDDHKGHKYLVDAAARIIERVPSAKFLLVGDGYLRDDLISQAKRLGICDHFLFLGHRNDVPEILSILDLFVLPSLWEGFPFVILEAMASQKPIVASGVDGIPEAIEDGKSGILVQPRNVNQLANSVIYLLKNPQKAISLSLEGQKRASAIFTWKKMVDHTQRFYQSLISSIE